MSILKTLEGLTALDDRERTIELQQRLGRMDRKEAEAHYVGGEGIGQALLLDSPGEPNAVLELVVSTSAGDSMAALYTAHPVFNTRDDYRKARRELVDIIEDLAGAGPSGVSVWCPNRKRATNVRDLALVQMLDFVRARVAAFQSLGLSQ